MEISKRTLHLKRTFLVVSNRTQAVFYLNSGVALCFSIRNLLLTKQAPSGLTPGEGRFQLIAYRRCSIVLSKGEWGEDCHTWMMKEGNEPIPALGKYKTAVHPAVGEKTMRKKKWWTACAEATVHFPERWETVPSLLLFACSVWKCCFGALTAWGDADCMGGEPWLHVPPPCMGGECFREYFMQKIINFLGMNTNHGRNGNIPFWAWELTF